jgi:hypothetical protein
MWRLFLSMRIRFTLTLVLTCLLVGCLGRNNGSVDREVVAVTLPRWSFLASASGQMEAGRQRLPKAVYVFPALRLNDQGQPMDRMRHREDDSGGLLWSSTAPAGHEIKMILEKKLRQQGFVPGTFSALTQAPEGHAILVLNPYYKEAGPSPYNSESAADASWINLIRIEAATFPLDLDPNKKREIFALEAVSLFNDQNLDDQVVKRAATYLLDHVGRSGTWSGRVNLLN